jgi:NADH-quinone oxidoreductase subunit J
LSAELVFFFLCAVVAVGASLAVIGQRNAMYSVLLLILSFAALAGLYVLLDAPFLAVIQIIIYAGAIMVLFLFVVMLLNAPTEEAISVGLRSARGLRVAGSTLAALLVVELVWALLRSSAATMGNGGDAGSIASVRELGRVLYTQYGFAFEVTSVLILVALVGAVVLAKREL